MNPPRCIYCLVLLADCERFPCSRRRERRATGQEVYELPSAPASTTWQLRDRTDQVRTVQVAARTQRQRDRSRRNVEHPPPPQASLRRGRPDR